MSDAAGWRLYFRARPCSAAVGTWALGLAVVLAAGPLVLELQIEASRLPRFVPVWELVPAVVSLTLPAFMCPRMWTWERLGSPRVSVCALLAGCICLLAPPLITGAAGPVVLPPDARYLDIAFNVLVIGSVSLFAVALAGPVVGPMAALTFYIATVVLQQTAPVLGPFLPLSGGDRSALMQAVVSAPFALAALAFWTWSRGRTLLADLFMRD